MSDYPRISRLVRAGLLTAIVDGTFSSVLAAGFYHSTVARLFQGVASTLLGPAALNGGTRTALIGVLMHIGVAFGWSAVFVLLVAPRPWVRALMASRYGTLKVAALFGPMVWMAMSLAVTDGGGQDTDPAPGKIAWPRAVTWPSGPYVVHFDDRSDGRRLLRRRRHVDIRIR